MTYIIRFSAFLITIGCFLLGMAVSVEAATKDIELALRPHCASTQSKCAEYLQYDPETLITNGLSTGDTFEVDLVDRNPSKQPIQSVQSWLEYDSEILEGDEVRISDSFPLVAPGEKDFASEKSLIKIGASNVAGGMRSPEEVFARISFKVIAEVPEDAIPARISFHQYQLLGSEGKTKVFVIEEGRTVNVLKTRPRDLRLYFGEDPPPTLIPPKPQPVPRPTPTPGPTPSPIPGPNPSPGPVVNPGADQFSLLRPQGLRLTTKNDEVYLMWSPLNDPAVIGYNVYYNTISGRYINRRTLGKQVTNVTISALPVGQRYFFAVTAYSADQRETDYSNEASIIIGDPTTSTSPLTITPTTPSEPPKDPVNVLDGAGSGTPAQTGMPISLAIGICALIGVAFLLRRRLSSSLSIVFHG